VRVQPRGRPEAQARNCKNLLSDVPITTGGGTVDVDFSGETGSGWCASYPSWSPAAIWADGAIVTNAPTGGIVRFIGGNAAVIDTLAFSKPVVDPVISLWSVGQGGDTVSFDFDATPVLVAGGPSAEYGGSSIWAVRNSAYGAEGIGTVQFMGTFTSLSWVNPNAEDWYGFNVGVAAAVREPGSLGLMPGGLVLVGAVGRRLGGTARNVDYVQKLAHPGVLLGSS
jgi:hypothetical protein